MPRMLRVEYAGAIYHIMSRGDRREQIYYNDVDRQDFLKTLAEACQKTGFEVHAYPWGSLIWYAAAREHRPFWIRVDRLLGEHGIQEDSAPGRQEFERRIEARRLEETSEDALKPLRRGWCWGGEEFKQQLLARMEGQLGDHHSGELKRETADARTERIIAEEMARLGWSKEQLAQKPKSDPGKLAIAARLRAETILTIRQIAAKLQMGTWKSANSRLHHWSKPNDTTQQQLML